jgi:hypothetical protein
MTLEELQKHYYVFKYKNEYLIHSLTEHGRSNHKYLCLAEKKRNSFKVIGYGFTSDIGAFKNQVDDYLSKLEYDSDYFMPMWRDGFKEECFVNDYMTSLGFKSHYPTYTYKNKDVYGGNTTNVMLTFNGLDDCKSYNPINKEEVSIMLWTSDYSWIETKVKRNFKDLQKGIDSLLKPLLLSESIQLLSIENKLKQSNIDIDIKGIDMNNLSLQSQEYKNTLKQKLQDILNTL